MRIAVVGSGPTGVAAAKVLLEAGHVVDLIDAGVQADDEIDAVAAELRGLHDRGERFTAQRLDGLRQVPGDRPRASVLSRRLDHASAVKLVLGSDYPHRGVDRGIPVAGASIPRSLAIGGLSNVWGAACYPLSPSDYAQWPVTEATMAPHYRWATRFLSVRQATDGLAGAYPMYGVSSSSLPAPSTAMGALTRRWAAGAARLESIGVAASAARLALRDTPEHSCRQCGLCLFGCPYDAIFNARQQVESLIGRTGFRYIGSVLVSAFVEDAAGVRLATAPGSGTAAPESRYDRLFVAAGCLSTLRLVAESRALYGVETTVQDNEMHVVPAHVRVDQPAVARSTFSLSEAVIAVKAGRISNYPQHIQLYGLHDYFMPAISKLLDRAPHAAEIWLRRRLARFGIAFIYLHGEESPAARARVRRRAGDLGLVELDVSANRGGNNGKGRASFSCPSPGRAGAEIVGAVGQVH